jgi:hypothetical protein
VCPPSVCQSLSNLTSCIELHVLKPTWSCLSSGGAQQSKAHAGGSTHLGSGGTQRPLRRSGGPGDLQPPPPSACSPGQACPSSQRQTRWSEWRGRPLRACGLQGVSRSVVETAVLMLCGMKGRSDQPVVEIVVGVVEIGMCSGMCAVQVGAHERGEL